MAASDMSDALELDEMGPIDYIVLEWRGEPTGEVAPHLIDLVDRGLIRVLDVAFLTKAEDGSTMVVDVNNMPGEGAGFSAFEGASSGLLDQEDLDEAATVLEPGTSAAVLIWENRWAAPTAVAMRRAGVQLVASGRIPVQAILAAVESADQQTN